MFQNGVFKLTNTNTGDPAPPASFSFGDPREFPVSGDFNGDGVDDVAVYRAGVWQTRLTGSGTSSTFTFGSGTWPSVVPVAGDWDGDGTDGIGLYCRVGLVCTPGTWMLRNTPDAGGADAGTFFYSPGVSPYPVVGDWNADGVDSVGVKAGTSPATWLLRNANTVGSPDVILEYGAAFDLPIVWTR